MRIAYITCFYLIQFFLLSDVMKSEVIRVVANEWCFIYENTLSRSWNQKEMANKI